MKATLLRGAGIFPAALLLVCLLSLGCARVASVADLGVTYSTRPAYWIDLCVIDPTLLRLSSGWDGEALAAGLKGGQLVSDLPVKGCPTSGHG